MGRPPSSRNSRHRSVDASAKSKRARVSSAMCFTVSGSPNGPSQSGAASPMRAPARTKTMGAVIDNLSRRAATRE